MRDIEIGVNDDSQRLDRFLKKYLDKANVSLIQKFLRTKKIKVNRKKVSANYILKKGDIVNIFIYEEELKKFITSKEKKYSLSKKLDIIYEDENIIILNKPKNLLSHAASKEDYGKNLVDFMISYLIEKGDFISRIEKTFVPSIINRLDRNTSGVVIGAKNAKALRELNRVKKDCIEKFYVTLVSGCIKKDFVIDARLEKDESKNKSSVSKNGRKSITEVFVEKYNNDFTFLKIKLVTGRTHQIRTHLSYKNFPIVGDIKYGDKKINKFFKEKFSLSSQFLHARSVRFVNLEGILSYLNGLEFFAPLDDEYKKILDSIF